MNTFSPELVYIATVLEGSAGGDLRDLQQANHEHRVSQENLPSRLIYVALFIILQECTEYTVQFTLHMNWYVRRLCM